MDQFIMRKKVTALPRIAMVARRIWTICRGATRIDGKPVTQGMKLTQAQCDEVNAIERDKALAWVDRNIKYR
jgi:lysozyme